MIPLEDLQRLKIFKATSPAALQSLAEGMQEKRAEPGEVIIKEGEETGTLFLILSGVVDVKKALDRQGGRSKIIARLESEEFFGEMAFLENEPYSATITAQSSVRLGLLPRRTLEAMMKQDAPSAMEKILTLLMGVSTKLRRTTRELVTVFEVSRLLGQALPFEELAGKIIEQIQEDMGDPVTVSFYRWNPFNDEYARMAARGRNSEGFTEVIDRNSPLLQGGEGIVESHANLTGPHRSFDPISLKAGHLVLARVEIAQQKEGLILYYADSPHYFDSGQRQMMETLSLILAPAMITARSRDEEFSRARLEQARQQGFSL